VFHLVTVCMGATGSPEPSGGMLAGATSKEGKAVYQLATQGELQRLMR